MIIDDVLVFLMFTYLIGLKLESDEVIEYKTEGSHAKYLISDIFRISHLLTFHKQRQEISWLNFTLSI